MTRLRLAPACLRRLHTLMRILIARIARLPVSLPVRNPAVCQNVSLPCIAMPAVPARLLCSAPHAAKGGCGSNVPCFRVSDYSSGQRETPHFHHHATRTADYFHMRDTRTQLPRNAGVAAGRREAPTASVRRAVDEVRHDQPADEQHHDDDEESHGTDLRARRLAIPPIAEFAFPAAAWAGVMPWTFFFFLLIWIAPPNKPAVAAPGPCLPSDDPANPSSRCYGTCAHAGASPACARR